MNKKGYTIVELILVIIILSFGLMSVLLALRYATVNSTYAQSKTIINWLCQERLEEYIKIRNDSGFDAGSLAVNTITESSVTDFAAYERITQVSYVDNLPTGNLETSVAGPTNYKRINVRVRSKDSGEYTEMSTIVTNY